MISGHGTARFRRWIPVGLAIAILAALAVYAVWDPSESRWFPRCPVLMLTGLRCPGCGSQRMVHALLHGDVVSALRYNALLTVLLPLIAALIIAEPLRERWPRFYAAVTSQRLLISVAVAMGLWTVLRNFAGL